jgi:uncharacterized protein (TIGR03437 family)
MLFATDLDLLSGESAAVVTAEAEDSQQRVFPLTVEFAGKVLALNWLTQINVRLPDELANTSEMLVRIRYHGIRSNKVLVNIKKE